MIVPQLQSRLRIAGFTLVELMAVILVASILFAIAIPSYQSQIRKSRRTDAKTAVLDLAAREEKYFSLNNSYTNSPANLGYLAASSTAGFPQAVGSGYYQVYLCVASTAGSTSASAGCTAANATATGTSYVAAATPATGATQATTRSCQ